MVRGFKLQIHMRTDVVDDPIEYQEAVFKKVFDGSKDISRDSLSHLKSKIPERQKFLRDNVFRQLFKTDTEVGFAITTTVTTGIWTFLEYGSRSPKGPIIRWYKGRLTPMWIRLEQLPETMNPAAEEKYFREFGTNRIPGQRVISDTFNMAWGRFYSLCMDAVLSELKSRKVKRERIL